MFGVILLHYFDDVGPIFLNFLITKSLHVSEVFNCLNRKLNHLFKGVVVCNHICSQSLLTRLRPTPFPKGIVLYLFFRSEGR